MSRFLRTMFTCNGLYRWLVLLFLVTTICDYNLLFGQSVPSTSEELSNPAYRSTVSEVRLVFFATDEHDHPLEELQKDDFAVVDDEVVIRDFRSFARSDLIKLDVMVLMDSSESVLPHFEEEIAEIQQLISHLSRSSNDTVSVLSFSGLAAQFVCSGDCRNSFTSDRIATLPKGGATPLFDAMEIATTTLMQRRQPDVWPVIILFSDGDDTISKSAFNDVRGKILASEEQIYAVDLNSPGPPSNGAATLQRIADDSGGRRLAFTAGAARILNCLIDDLHSARTVTYSLPKSSSDFHSVRILPTHNLKLQFRCRRGYYYPSGGAHTEGGP